MIKVAITGNIASGKSQVEQIISSKFKVFDTDKMTHKILESITEFYAFDIVTNKKIDRKKLGKIVFSDPYYRKKLENIIHPKIKNEILNIFSQSDNIVFISIPLLFETGFDKLFDKIIFVDAKEEIRIQRIMKRNNLSEFEAIQRINSQKDSKEKIQKSDFVINNNGSIKELEQQTLILIRELSSFI